MRLEQLVCLVDVANTGSLTSTAKRMFVSQQAVSKSIRQLEEEMGITILNRAKTGVTFTEDGLDAVDFARTVLKEREKFHQRIEEKQQRKINWTNENIHICTTTSIINTILPDIYFKLYAKQDVPKLQLSTSNSLAGLIGMLARGEADIGIGIVREHHLIEQFGLEQDVLAVDVLMQDEFVLVRNIRFRNNETVIDTETYSKMPIKTSYDIDSLYNDYSKKEQYSNIICSLEADFHRKMMDNVGAVTIMPGLSYRCHFNNKKYFAMQYEESSLSMAHVAMYRKDASPQVKELVSMIRREMYMK